MGSNNAPNHVGSLIQFLWLKLYIISFNRWLVSIKRSTFKSPDDKVSTQDILISGYLEPFRNDRNCFGGGVLIYIADYLHASRRYDLEFRIMKIVPEGVYSTR
jgi:hypothetical protein